MRRWQKYHFFNPATKRAVANWINALLLFTLLMEFLSTCESADMYGDKGCFTEVCLSPPFRPLLILNRLLPFGRRLAAG
jgi:hypothetical protein